MADRISHRWHAGLTFLLIVLGSGILLPLVRVQPASAHKYINALQPWIRVSLAFSLCVVFTGVIFKLLSPRLGHLAHWKAYPPAWLAALLAWIVVATIDVFGGFDPNGYRATVWEWLGYGGGSLLVVSSYSGLWAAVDRRFTKKKESQVEATEVVTAQDIENASWNEIESWLVSDAPARYDFLGNQSVAHRVSRLISEGTRSVGIVGPFGAGKTSIVRWVAVHLKKQEACDHKYFVCHHSCWGFETSDSAIRDMLKSAVAKLSAEIDTFQIDSLPETYRQTFSAGGTWIEAISKLVLPNPGPEEQFSRLSDLLAGIDGRLVFIVEDLDRNDTRNFEIEEVLAFLERLKGYPNLSFILTGGLTSSQRIDYAKLCDHIEPLRTIQPRSASTLITKTRQQCLNGTAFHHVPLADSERNYEWSPLNEMLALSHEEFSLLQATATLLNTPRSLRHALGRTHSAWKTLHGEIDLDHLLAVNILRFGAPECFSFLLRRWDRLHSCPTQYQQSTNGTVNEIRLAVLNDWSLTTQDVKWNPAAALRLMLFILPATKYWLIDSNPGHQHAKSGQQHVPEERYWIRAINEIIEPDEVRDQEVIRDLIDWIDTRKDDSVLVCKLTSSECYSDIWEYLAVNLLANRRAEILLLCEQVLRRILTCHGSSASGDSQGFVHTWRFAYRRVLNEPSNQTWLQDRISEAVSISIEMANDLWHYYGSPSRHSILLKDNNLVRRHMLEAARRWISDGPKLISVLSTDTSSTLYKLVFDPGSEHTRILVDVQSWSWLGPHILAALRDRNVIVATNCGVLLSAYPPWQEKTVLNTEVLDQFFGSDANEVIDILDSMISQLSEEDRSLVDTVVRAARQHLTKESSTESEDGKAASD